ncbi:MAG: Npt1/Npt2 family nucleotide transporter, partial [Cyclonatronaceae bacterium]
MKAFFARFYDVRPGEGRLAATMFAINFLLMVILYFLKPARDSLFLVELGALQLPLVYILVAVASIPVTRAVSYLVQRFNNFRVFLWTNVFVLSNLLLLRGLFVLDFGWVYTAFYIWVGVYSILIISQFWIFANELFDTSQSKRLFSLLNMGAILGAVAGSQVSSLAVSLLDIRTENLLFICMGLVALITGIIYSLKNVPRPVPESARELAAVSPKPGYKSVLSSKYQLMIAGIIGLGMLVSTLADYQLKAVAAEVYGNKAALTAFMGNFYAGLSIASLAIQLLLSRRVMQRIGIGGALITRPAGIALSSVLMLIEPVLAVAVLLNGLDGATQYSVDKTGRELLFLPLSQHTKERVKLFLDVFVDRVFRGVAGLVLLGLVVGLGASVQQLAWIVGGAALLWLYLSILARREYVNQFSKSLNKRYIDLQPEGADLNEPSVAKQLKAALGCDNAQKLYKVMDLLEGQDIEQFEPELRRLLHFHDTRVQLRALQLLKTSPRSYKNDVKRLISVPDAEIRMEVIHYLCQHGAQDPMQAIMDYMESSHTSTRAAAISCACRHGGEQVGQMIEENTIEEVLEHKGEAYELPRAQIAEALGSEGFRKDAQALELALVYLPLLLQDASAVVRRSAIESMGRLQHASFIPLLIHQLEDPAHALQARKALTAFGSSSIRLLSSYYDSGRLSVRSLVHLLKAIADMRIQPSADALLRMLEAEQEPGPRRRIIKALNRLRSHTAAGRISFPPPLVRAELQRELMYYYELFAVRQPVGAEPECLLLCRAIGEKMQETLENVFRLLGLLYHHKDMYSAYLGLNSPDRKNRGRALELLENLLDKELHRLLFPVVDSGN